MLIWILREPYYLDKPTITTFYQPIKEYIKLSASMISALPFISSRVLWICWEVGFQRLLEVPANFRDRYLVTIFTARLWLILDNQFIHCFATILLNSRRCLRSKISKNWKLEVFSLNSVLFQILTLVLTKLLLLQIKCRSISAVGHIGNLSIMKTSPLLPCLVQLKPYMTSMVICNSTKSKLWLVPTPMPFAVPL